MTDASGRSLRILIAPDSFGGALDSVGVSAAIASGWSAVRTGDEILQRPMADGGEGTLAAIAVAVDDAAERRSTETTDPLGRPITADWLLLDDGRSAFVEMAAASGLALLAPEERTPENARRASTRGTGDLIRAALDAGVQHITIGLGDRRRPMAAAACCARSESDSSTAPGPSCPTAAPPWPASTGSRRAGSTRELRTSS